MDSSKIKKFYLPGYYNQFEYYLIFDKFYQSYQNYFIDDRIIAGAYDLPYGLIWNGGRVNLQCDLTFHPEQTRQVIDYFQQKDNFSLLHTCTNLLLTKEQYNDKLCNDFIQQYYRPQDKIIIADLKLKEYLKDKYSNLSFVNSTTLGIIDIDEVNKITENEIYVIYFGKNGDNSYLQQLVYPENIEILCAEPCMNNCPNRKDHYILASQVQLGNKVSFQKNFSFCPFDSDPYELPLIDIIEKDSDFRVNNKRINELSKMGFNHFKISGRLLNAIEWFELITYYLVKPEYHGLVYNTLINEYIKK